MIDWFWSRPYLLLTFTALFWAGNSVVARAARDMVPPVALAFWRWALALLLLLPFAWPHLQRDWRVLRVNLRWVLTLGTLGIGTFNTLLYSGLQKTTAVNGLLLQSLQPALILVLGALAFKEVVLMQQVIGICLSIAGALVIVLHGDLSSLIGLKFNAGDLVICVAVLVWSFYSTLLRKRPIVHPLSFLAATFMVGTAVILPFYLAETANGQLIENRFESWLAIGYVCLFPSLIAYLFFNRGVELLGSAAAALYLNVMPVIGSVLAIAILSEPFGWFHLAGMVLIGAGIASATTVRVTQSRGPSSSPRDHSLPV
ncbi:DMT family transporter [Novosphingobium sp. 17-62-19]|uniref:DMT family transporter n=1 Tax=Novosphingobium sp. 17-62-19 TaxID=1970406 RepID=UPI0025E8A22A|nr:DMT family transporter [Novosphingobium sp. 17-62-19]